MRRHLLVLLLTLSLGGTAMGKNRPVADTILTNARIYTVNARAPWAEAVAIKDGKVLAVGSARRIARYGGPSTRTLDAHGRLVLPGFIDSHIHFVEGSLAMSQVKLDDTKSVAEIQQVVREFAQSHPATSPETAWITGRGWSYPEFADAGGMPHKKFLDDVVPDRPVLLVGFDGHTSWANSKALEMAGVTRTTPDPLNGKIVRDANGEPTGALQEAAGSLVARIVPKTTAAERMTAMQAGMVEANRAGLTRVIICGNDTAEGNDANFSSEYEQLQREGKLTLRFSLSIYAAPESDSAADVARAERALQLHPRSDDWIAGGAVKLFLDGVIEGHTAAMLGPYGDDPKQFGSLNWDPEQYKKTVAALDRHGIQVYTHAIGDRAVRVALDAYESAAAENHTRDRRHRIEHIETITAEDIPRFGKLGVIASFQPLHANPDEDTLGPWLTNAGHQREPRAWAWQSIAKSGGRLAFGSDWPVVTLNPWAGVQTAVTRQTREGKPAGGWVPEQRVSVAQAVEAYTLGAAFSGHREQYEGTIETGKLADLIVVSQDIFRVAPHSIGATEVLITIVGGKIVYESPAWRAASAGR
jgi:predicted amidohydrolase YtcJ